MSRGINLEWAARTQSGSRKPRNDDAIIAFASDLAGASTLPDQGSHSIADYDLVFAVSDGMGGGNAGHVASAMILQQMAEMIPQTFKAAASGFFPDSISHLRDALRSVHEEINHRAVAENSGMAATLALAWFTPENLYLANVGDSRIYRSRAGVLEQLSRDHTLAWGQWKRREISEVEYRGHPRRAALYEVVGGGHSTVNPHFAAIAFEIGDRFLVCSDGLVDGLWERHISDALGCSERSCCEIADSLLKRAIDNSGIDDTSLLVIAILDLASRDGGG